MMFDISRKFDLHFSRFQYTYPTSVFNDWQMASTDQLPCGNTDKTATSKYWSEHMRSTITSIDLFSRVLVVRTFSETTLLKQRTHKQDAIMSHKHLKPESQTAENTMESRNDVRSWKQHYNGGKTCECGEKNYTQTIYHRGSKFPLILNCRSFVIISHLVCNKAYLLVNWPQFVAGRASMRV